jgi:hypothetical protein
MPRVVSVGYLVIGDPELPGTECPTCGFDAVVVIPIHLLTTCGVSSFGEWRGCIRCRDMERTK